MAHTDAKFDSYLKRTLDSKVYEQVRVSDPCVVVGKNEKHTFRFAFITNETIVITENPPKSIVFTVPFSDLRDVQLVHDSPKFLQKELQDIVHHISIKHISKSEISLNSVNLSVPPNLNPASKKGVFSSVFNPKKQSESNQKASLSSTKNPAVNITNASVVSDGDSLGSSFDLRHSTNKSRDSKSIKDFFFRKQPTLSTSVDNLSASSGGSESILSDEKLLSSSASLKWSGCDPHKIEVVDSIVCDTNDLHLYVLNDASVFYMMLRVVWHNYLLESTISMSRQPSETSSFIKEITKTLLDDLKNDILNGYYHSISLEDVYKYFHELQIVSMKSMMVRKYFWRDSSLFTVCGDYLTKYSQSKSPSHSIRADEIECMVLICENLCFMLRHTEALPSCDKVIQKSCNSSFYSDLLKVLVTKPNLPGTQQNNEELVALVQDYTIASCIVLYELIRIAEQVTWNSVEMKNPVFTSPFLMSLMNHQTGLVSFLKRILNHCVSLWTTASSRNPSVSDSVYPTMHSGFESEALNSVEVVKIHRCFTVIHRCLKKCLSAKQVKHTFAEEFKYFIRPETLKAKIPSIYPACGITRNIVAAVGSCVVDNAQTILKEDASTSNDSF